MMIYTNQSGKSPNCIMTTSYLMRLIAAWERVGIWISMINPDGIAVLQSVQVLQSHKRFKINMQPTTVAE
jgi:hypothetical protein